VYHFDCVCGAEIVSANPKGKCWDCGREFELDLSWLSGKSSDPNLKTITGDLESGK
jgi:hypothetical protein